MSLSWSLTKESSASFSALDLLLSASLSLILGSIFNIFILNLLTSSGVVEFFNYFSCLISVLIYFCFGGYCFLTTIFDDCLLRNRLTHSAHASSHTEATWLERTEALIAESSLTSLTSEEVIFVFKPHHTEASSEWVSTLFGCHIVIITLLSLSKAATHIIHVWELSSEKVIFIIKEVGEWISAPEEVSEYFFCTVHVELAEVSSIVEMELWLSSSPTTILVVS